MTNDSRESVLIEATPLTTPLCWIVVRCVHTPTLPRNPDTLTHTLTPTLIRVTMATTHLVDLLMLVLAIVSTIITLTLTNLNPIPIHTLHLILMPRLTPTALSLHPNVI